jgi:hypothetical protein
VNPTLPPARLAEILIAAGVQLQQVFRVLRRRGVPNPISMTIDAALRVEQGATS